MIRRIVKKVVPRNAFRVIEPYGHLAEAMLVNAKHGFPARGLKVIGVTGTNGKTTTCFLIHRMLHEAGYKVGLMTTVAYGAGSDIKQNMDHVTTPGPGAILRKVKKLREQGIEWLVLEVTSHALAQHRVWGIPFEIAVMTNLTHEHLDYHGTFERYRDAKRKLFAQTNRYHGLQVGVVNADDASAGVFAATIKNPVLYGIKKGDVRADKVKLTAAGVSYQAKAAGETYDIKCNLPGSFNVYNSLAAVSVGRAVGLSKKEIEQGIAALEGVEGRMTKIDEGQDFDIIIDYAHTPDSFEKLFKDIKPVIQGRLLVMFGSAGRRDEAKRAAQGKLAGEYADEVVLTEEDDRDMDGEEILRDIAKGAEQAGKKQGKNLFLVHDRGQAIKFIFERAKKGDTVILLGKGHEKDILRNGPKAAELRHIQQDDTNPQRVIKTAWDEAAEARKALRKLQTP
ncbi:MAG TPA: UDP-N-acetylmuramyl-tripeptide synthetase [Candidatus Saccharimonadales bacterium]|nr:UDP-N-acetylmuramyl-tripeptide synthetase [Candidatus Saccharimonadales bacterium]